VGVEGFLACGVVWLYGIPFECNPYKGYVLVVFWFGKICLSTGIHDTTDTAAPILQECSFEEHVGNGWVLWERMMRLQEGGVAVGVDFMSIRSPDRANV